MIEQEPQSPKVTNPSSNKFHAEMEKQVGLVLIRMPVRWYEFEDLLLAYKPHIVLPQFRELVDAFYNARMAFNDPARYHLLLVSETRKFWEREYWTEASSLPGEDFTLKVAGLRKTLAEVLARIDVKETINTIYQDIDRMDIPLSTLSDKLLRAFNRITSKEGMISWKEVPLKLYSLVATQGASKAFPFPFLSEALGFSVDIFRGDITVVMGRTGRGKTTLSINIAKAFIESGYNVCYVSTEMTEEAIATKLVAAVTDTEWRYLYGREFDPDIAIKAAEKFAAFQEQNSGNMFIFHKARCTVSDIAAAAASTKSLYNGVDLIIVDYIQQVESSVRRKEDTRAYELAQIVGELADISSYENCAVIVVSQVNSQGEVKDARAIEERAGLAVRLGMLSEQAFIEETKRLLNLQDKVLPDEIRDRIRAQYKKVVDVEVKKNRYGLFDARHRYLKFDGSRCKILGAWTEHERQRWLNEISKGLERIREAGRKKPTVYESDFVGDEVDLALEDEEFGSVI